MSALLFFPMAPFSSDLFLEFLRGVGGRVGRDPWEGGGAGGLWPQRRVATGDALFEGGRRARSVLAIRTACFLAARWRMMLLRMLETALFGGGGGRGGV